MSKTVMIRKEPRASNGWNNGDLDVAFQLFQDGLVWDGNVCSKEGRDHFISHGYAIRAEGYTALTGKGTLRLLRTPCFWRSVWKRWWRWKKNPLVDYDTQKLSLRVRG